MVCGVLIQMITCSMLKTGNAEARSLFLFFLQKKVHYKVHKLDRFDKLSKRRVKKPSVSKWTDLTFTEVLV